MATAFTPWEKEQIEQKLMEAASLFASSIGMRKTTVDQIAAHAGISKGAFYRFYDSKELLFFHLMERWHTEVYEEAWQAIEEAARAGLDHRQQMANSLIRACEIMEQNSMMDFMENDLPILLRKVPPEIISEHYHSDEVHIGDLLRRSGATLLQPVPIAATAVRALLLTLSHRAELGEEYPQVLRILIQGVCQQLIAD